jgi:SAM-dependent methyltransferase
VSASGPPKLFDRALLDSRLDRAIRARAENPGADFLLTRAVQDMSDRLASIRREFAVALDFATPAADAAAPLAARAGLVFRLARTRASLGAGDFLGLVGDPEHAPFGENRFDLVVSLLALQHIDDLPGALIQIRDMLRPDGLLLAALIGGDTLAELRQSLVIAESEVSGGASPRVAPFADARALGGLLQRAGFALPVVDSDRLVARYSDLVALARDLRAVGATNALIARSRSPLRRDLFARAGEIYAERFADPDGRLRATFETLWLSGWKPHSSQPKPLRPGSAKARLADALNSARRDAE